MPTDEDYDRWFYKGSKFPFKLIGLIIFGPFILLGFILEKSGLWKGEED